MLNLKSVEMDSKLKKHLFTKYMQLSLGSGF